VHGKQARLNGRPDQRTLYSDRGHAPTWQLAIMSAIQHGATPDGRGCAPSLVSETGPVLRKQVRPRGNAGESI